MVDTWTDPYQCSIDVELIKTTTAILFFALIFAVIALVMGDMEEEP